MFELTFEDFCLLEPGEMLIAESLERNEKLSLIFIENIKGRRQNYVRCRSKNSIKGEQVWELDGILWNKERCKSWRLLTNHARTDATIVAALSNVSRWSETKWLQDRTDAYQVYQHQLINEYDTYTNKIGVVKTQDPSELIPIRFHRSETLGKGPFSSNVQYSYYVEYIPKEIMTISQMCKRIGLETKSKAKD